MDDSSKIPGNELANIKRLITLGDVQINENALQSAMDDFAWEARDVKAALLKLKPAHFHKSAPYKDRPGVTMDYYKAPKLHQNCDVYTHFYVRTSDAVVVISSFKKR